MLGMLGVLAGCKLSVSTAPVPTATKAAVQIIMQNARFGVSEPLGILVKNTGKTDVYARDGLASCTVLQLQQYDSQKKAWVAVDRCQQRIQPQVRLIRAGMTEPFTLAPSSSGDPNTWDSGTYRIALTFTTQPDGTTATQVAYSQGFTIQSS